MLLNIENNLSILNNTNSPILNIYILTINLIFNQNYLWYKINNIENLKKNEEMDKICMFYIEIMTSR